GTLDLGTSSTAAGSVTLASGSIAGTTGVLSGSSYAVQSGSISAILGGSGALAKSTVGTVTLSAANTYSGGTTISAGKLVVNNVSGSGTGTGAVAVNSGGTLGGGGSISGAVTVASGGHVAPGNSIGNITVSALTLDSGSHLDIELGAPVSGDQVNVTTPSTGLTLNGGLVDITNAGGMGDGTYVLIDYDTAFLGSLNNLSIASAPAGFNYSLVNDTGATAIDVVVAQLAVSPTSWKNDAS